MCLFNVSQVNNGGDAWLLMEPSDIDNCYEESCFWQGSKRTRTASETISPGSYIDFKSKNIQSIRFGCDDWLTAEGLYHSCQREMRKNLMWRLSCVLSKPQKCLGLLAALGLIEVDRGGGSWEREVRLHFTGKKAKMLLLRLMWVLLLLQMIYIFNLAGSQFLIQISWHRSLRYQPVRNVESLVLTRRYGSGCRHSHP